MNHFRCLVLAFFASVWCVGSAAAQSSWTEGSSRDLVLQLQGTPDSVRKWDALGHEVWRYGLSSVEISLVSGKVLQWDNSGGNLKVALQPRTSGTGGGTFTEGSHRDDVLRLQGTPDSVRKWDALGHEVWRYGLSSVEISLVSGKVLQWDNSGGNLKVALHAGAEAGLATGESITRTNEPTNQSGVQTQSSTQSITEQAPSRPTRRYSPPPPRSSDTLDELFIVGGLLAAMVVIALVAVAITRPGRSSSPRPAAPSIPKARHSNQPTSRTTRERSKAGFRLWWPQTDSGKGLWLLLLVASSTVGAIRGWNSAGRYDDEAAAAFVGGLSASVGWYIILVVVRYTAWWFTERSRPSQAQKSISPQSPKPTLIQSNAATTQDQTSTPCPKCGELVESPFMWLEDGKVECQHCGYALDLPCMKPSPAAVGLQSTASTDNAESKTPSIYTRHEPTLNTAGKVSWWWPSSGLGQGVFITVLFLSGLTIFVEPVFFVFNVGINYLIAVGIRAAFIKITTSPS